MNDVWEKNLIIIKADELAHLVYKITRNFPKEEVYGITSQIRRAVLSVPLNLIEGYSRFKIKSHIQFLEIAFGSLKETHYLIDFSHKEQFLMVVNYQKMVDLCIEIEKMLYAKMRTMKSKI